MLTWKVGVRNEGEAVSLTRGRAGRLARASLETPARSHFTSQMPEQYHSRKSGGAHLADNVIVFSDVAATVAAAIDSAIMIGGTF